jgi:glutaminase
MRNVFDSSMVAYRLHARLALSALLLASCATAGGAPMRSSEPRAVPPERTAAPPDAAAEARRTAGPPGEGVDAAPPERMDERAIEAALEEAHRRFRGVNEGENADYIPALAQVDSSLYGIALVTVDGQVYEVGDARHPFSIQSVGKIFTLARAVDMVGADAVEERIGVNATGQPFNSILAIELNHAEEGRSPAGNPLVNAGAIGTVDLLPANGADAKWDLLLGTYSAFAGRELAVNEQVYRSETETNTRNQAIVRLLESYEVVQGDPSEALDLYTRQCSVNVSARDLAAMGATLANGGTNPIVGERVVSEAAARHVLAVMTTAGLYETTGEWIYTVGVPAKSGVGGGIVAVVPGRFAVATFSPPLDEAGNSVRGQRAIQSIVERFDASMFAAHRSAEGAERAARTERTQRVERAARSASSEGR